MRIIREDPHSGSSSVVCGFYNWHRVAHSGGRYAKFYYQNAAYNCEETSVFKSILLNILLVLDEGLSILPEN